MAKMPPPGGSGVAIVIAPKDSGKMPPPGSAPEKQGGGKASREDAGFRTEDQKCIDCSNYSPDTGECSKVEGTMSPMETCGNYFNAMDDEEGESPSQESGEDESVEAVA